MAGIRGGAGARPAFVLVAFGFAVFRTLACGFAARRVGFLADFLGFTTRRRDAAFLLEAFARR